MKLTAEQARIAAYEDEVPQGTRNFWSQFQTPQGQHPYHQHPVLGPHGQTLAQEAFDYNRQKSQERGMQGHPNPQQMMMLFQDIFRREQAHKGQLVELAKDIVSQTWGIPKDKLHAELTMQVGGDPAEPEEPEEPVELTPELQKEVNKRVTLNTMTQGAAVQNYMTLHHMVKDALNAVDPGIVADYDRITAGSVGMYWAMDLQEMLAMLGMSQAGSSGVEKQQSGEMMVVARAVIFPVLVQELVKGTMEMLSLHGLNQMDPETYKAVTQHADKLEDEVMQIQVGPALWNRFLKVVPKGETLSRVIAALAKRPADEVNYIVSSVVTHPEDAQEMLTRLLQS